MPRMAYFITAGMPVLCAGSSAGHSGSPSVVARASLTPLAGRLELVDDPREDAFAEDLPVAAGGGEAGWGVRRHEPRDRLHTNFT